jgi:hypothetical protein
MGGLLGLSWVHNKSIVHAITVKWPSVLELSKSLIAFSRFWGQSEDNGPTLFLGKNVHESFEFIFVVVSVCVVSFIHSLNLSPPFPKFMYIRASPPVLTM